MIRRMRRAAASEAKPLLGLYSLSGGGKTKTALLIAKGFAGDMSRVAMIETEAGRGEAYADDPVVGGYSVVSLRESFSPKDYGESIAEVEASGAEVLIIDSASHEWEGVGGVLAMAAQNEADGKKGPLVWQQPKIQHAREFVLRITQSPVPLVVVNMRARFPMYQVAPKDVERWEAAGKPGGDKAKPRVGEWAKSWQLDPIQSDAILYEMMIHAWLDDEHRLHVTKYTLDDMRDVFRDGERATVETGERLAKWAKRTKSSEPITAEQVTALEAAARERGVPVDKLLAKARVAALAQLPAPDFERALSWISKQGEART